MYLAPACTLWSALGVWCFEWPTMQRASALSLVAAKPGVYLAAAAMGFGVNWLAFLLIQLASSLTLKVCLQSEHDCMHRVPQVLGTVKNTLTVWLGILMFGETVTPLQGVGYTISLIGFLRYNMVQMQLIKAQTAGDDPVTILQKPGAADETKQV